MRPVRILAPTPAIVVVLSRSGHCLELLAGCDRGAHFILRRRYH